MTPRPKLEKPEFLRKDHPAFHAGDASLLKLDREMSQPLPVVTIGDAPLTTRDILAVARSGSEVRFTEDATVLGRIAHSHSVMMQNIEDAVPVYGCNTGYGAQATISKTHDLASTREWYARTISEAISAIDVSVGPEFSPDVVRAGMLVRIHMLMGGFSAVKLADLELIRQLLNRKLTPIVNQYGGLGASGDLAQNARVVSVLRQLRGARVRDDNGRTRDAREALSDIGIEPLILDPKAGLGLCNGDNFSTALGTLLAADTLRVVLAAVATSTLMFEVLQGSDRVFHPLLEMVRPHEGQAEIAGLFRTLLQGSQLARLEMTGPRPRPDGAIVQEGYSLRTIAQYLGVSAERLKTSFATLIRNANAVSDNPLWVSPECTTPGEEPWQWVSGGNFLAMHAAEVMDGLRKTLTQIVKLCDRHLARLVNPHTNNGLPANLSEPLSISNCAFKGVQIQAGMFDVYSQILSFPVTTLFGVHEEGNQDLTTHALTSGILGLENLRLARYAVAQNLLAAAQAVDLRGGPQLLSPRTRPVYDLVRSRSEFVMNEKPLSEEIESLYQTLVTDELGALLRSTTFAGLENDIGL